MRSTPAEAAGVRLRRGIRRLRGRDLRLGADGAVPGDYDVGLLITIYAIVILGGGGSLAGVIAGR
jgi:hypothetical protein